MGKKSNSSKKLSQRINESAKPVARKNAAKSRALPQQSKSKKSNSSKKLPQRSKSQIDRSLPGISSRGSGSMGSVISMRRSFSTKGREASTAQDDVAANKEFDSSEEMGDEEEKDAGKGEEEEEEDDVEEGEEGEVEEEEEEVDG